MIETIERLAHKKPHNWCFRFIDNFCSESTDTSRLNNLCVNDAVFSWEEVRLYAAIIADLLSQQGVQRADAVVIDAPNNMVYPFVLVAAAYGGFVLVTLNNRLSDTEKLERLDGLAQNYRLAARYDEVCLTRLMSQVQAVCAHEQGCSRALRNASVGTDLFNSKAPAVVMFTSGTTGSSKAAVLSWDNLCGSARAANETFGCDGYNTEGKISTSSLTLWQAVLPLYHVGGLQVFVRSVLAGRPCVLYRRFDAQRILADVVNFKATHISVVDKTLRDLLDCAETDREALSALQMYRCVLLGGAAINPRTLERARAAGVRVYASYGMTETSSALAASSIDCAAYTNAIPQLTLLPGYKARIVDPDSDGFGILAVAGPGVSHAYANAGAMRTVDGFFVTGDVAALVNGQLVVRERTDDLFISGGENVYPAQIVSELRAVDGVADAYVIGISDATWGRRPVAFIERDQSDIGQSALLAAQVREKLATRLSRISRPDQVIVLDTLPRSGIGKFDRHTLEHLYEQRIDVTEVHLHRRSLPFIYPVKTARAELTTRELLFVEVRDVHGHVGFGECSSFENDWYLPETLVQDEQVVREVLMPFVCTEVFAHPSDAYRMLAALPKAAAFPMARTAVEMALWDLYGQIVCKPLWQLIGGKSLVDDAKRPMSCDGLGTHKAALKFGAGAAMLNKEADDEIQNVRVPLGAVVGIASVDDTLTQVERLVAVGVHRIKLKIAPGCALQRVQALRTVFPNLVLSLDANQSFSSNNPTHREELHELDTYGVSWIEEPLMFEGMLANQHDPAAAHERFNCLAQLQASLRTPICLDESFFTIDEAYDALAHPELRCFAIKIGKFGGIAGALAFIHNAHKVGARVWMSGMYDSGIARSVHAAFETLSGIDDPGDLSAPACYFIHDTTYPPYVSHGGFVELNSTLPYGIGYTLN